MSAVGSLVSQAPLKARFINVLIHPVLLRAFLEFCALPSELALESLLFVLDVERFRHVQPSMARLLANYIYLSYIAPYAPLRINVSRQMRDRIPWPFLPGWEYSPWVFDEMLASIGFTLKKHTLLRFERSPVGLFALMGQEGSGFSPEEYVRPLRLDLDYDPMMAIVAQFEPDIDVVVWVNDLDIDHSSSHVVTSLAQLTVGFREQLLMRVAAQFVNEHLAYSLCDSYFQLATRIRPLQKQRRIKKTRKIRNFFGDHPHEALLRQQLMAIVPPSSQRQAARAAAEMVARKRCSEEAHRRRAKKPLNHKSSISSSVLAEQKILAMDSDSDIEKEHMHGWAQLAMQKPRSSWSSLRKLAAQRERSWSDSDDDRSDGEWPHHGSAKRRRCRHQNSIGALSASACDKAYYNDQTLRRALSMIGASKLESLTATALIMAMAACASARLTRWHRRSQAPAFVAALMVAAWDLATCIQAKSALSLYSATAAKVCPHQSANLPAEWLLLVPRAPARSHLQFTSAKDASTSSSSSLEAQTPPEYSQDARQCPTALVARRARCQPALIQRLRLSGLQMLVRAMLLALLLPLPP
ncbi:hypothetical protein BX661DRAFT_77670 [Kickxella alabastrina]|uniref:uncharacterized protein n=1 Tax=Kickxella alabastrina TaxID=61397 RepID=UPI00221F2B25|nr:uncharacterized protein BX661DRAFT_77670 [Kickxella alabastrina]KAI7820229.1 hypothetical protein BX661DRAFT_77670 [Kickxella alabastrina]